MNTDYWKKSAQEFAERNNLLVVDALNLAFRWKHKGQNEFSADFVQTVNSLAKSYNARKIVILTDFKGSAYRKAIHPKYKSDRKLKYVDQTQEEEDAAAAFFEGFKRTIELCRKNFATVQMEGVEADDLAWYMVDQFEDAEEFDKIWLVSTDKDWDELLSPTCSRFAYTTRKEYTIDNYWDEHGCDTPEEFTSMKAIMGDPGDSVYGVDGIGAKRAYNLVREYGSALDLALELPLEGKQVYIQNLNQSEEKLILNTQLVDLRSFSLEAIAYPNESNLETLTEICNELRGL